VIPPRAKLVPQPNALTRPYWEAAARGAFVIQRCADCRHWIHFPEQRCPACGSAKLGYEPVSGRGTVETFTVVHRSFAPGFEAEGPYVVAWIALAEQRGLRTMGNVAGCAPEEVVIGLPVEVFFEPRGELKLPNFRLRRGQ
jgi:uncharacterized OB-fold protein